MGKCKADDRKFYSDMEKVLLLSLVEKFKHILENKKTDATNWQKKNEAWKNISELYNGNDVHARTEKQLKKLWDNLKQRTRKNDSDIKKHIIQTGGGPPPPPENQDPINEMVRAIVPTIGYVVDNPWDSTSVMMKAKRQEADALDNDTSTPKRCKLEDPLLIQVNNGIAVEDVTLEDEPQQDATESSSHITNSTLKKFNKDTETKTNQKSSTIKNSLFSPPKTPNRRVTTRIEEEAALRIEKLKRSIEQQEELHLIRVEAATAERDYWLKKK